MITNIDTTIFLFLNSFTGKSFYLDFFFFLFAFVFPLVVFLLILFFLFRNIKKNRSFVTESLFAGFFAKYGVVEPLRYFFPRTRPFEVLEQVNLILPHKESFSMPSGCSAFLFAISTVIYFHNKKVGVVMLIFSFVSVFSRVVSGMSYSLDVVAGGLVGLIVAVLTNGVMEKIRAKK
jgi:undecaprenyl-diphosphatase